MPRTRWNEIVFPWLPRPAWEARQRELVIMVQEWGLVLHAYTAHQSKLLLNKLLTPYFVFSFGFLSEISQLWKQTRSLFGSRLSLPSTYSGFVCPVSLFAWLNAVPGKRYFWARMKSMTCLQGSWGSSEVSVSRFWHVSRCVSPVWCQYAWCQYVPFDLGGQDFPCSC